MGRRLRTWTIAVLVGLTAAACGGDSGTEAVRGRLGAVPSPSSQAAATGTASPGDAARDSASSAGADTVASDAATPGAPAPTARPETAVGRAAATTAGSPARKGTPASPTTGRPKQRAADAPSNPSAAGDANASSSPGVPASPAAGDHTGVTDQDIVFGMHAPQSGPLGVLVGKGWHAADAYFRSVNDAGGIHGRKIRFVVVDDGYSAQKAAGAIRDLVDTKKVFGASCFIGVDQCVVGLEYANARGVPYLHSGMREAIVEQAPWAYPVTPSYPNMSDRLVDYLFTRRAYTKDRRIAALHLNSANFDESVERFERRLAHYGAKFAVKSPVEKDQSDFSAAITKMQNAGVDTVWLAVDPTLIAKFASQAKLLRFQPQYVCWLICGDLTARVTGGNLDGAYGLSPVADPDWNGEGMARFKETFKRYYADEEPDEFHVFAYVEAQAFVEGLRRAGPNLGRKAFAQGMATIDLLDSGVSSPLSYAKRSRATAGNGALAVWEIHGTKADQVGGFDF